MVNGPPGTSTSKRSTLGRRRRSGERTAPGRRPELVGGQHGLGMLLLVLGDHAEDEAALGQPATVQRSLVQQVDHLRPDLTDVPPGLGRVEQRERRAIRPRVLERVIQLVDRLRQDRVPATDIAQQPEFLLVADVREVPHQRRHQPGVLARQVTVVQRTGEQVGSSPCAVEIVHDPVADRVVGSFVGVADGPVRSSRVRSSQVIPPRVVGQLVSRRRVGADVVGRTSATVGPSFEVAVHVTRRPGLVRPLQ